MSSPERASGGSLESRPPQEQMCWEEWCDSLERRSHPCVGLAAHSLAFVKFQAWPDVFPQATRATAAENTHPVTEASLPF